MKFCSIVPIKYLDSLAGLSHGQMALAQWLSNKHYLEFYRQRVADGDFVILDNGACELRTSIPTDELLRAYNLLGGCSVLVIPDSDEGNMELFKEFIDAKPKLKKTTKLMAVPHNLADLDIMVKFAEVDIIGLNRDFEDIGRAGIVEDYRLCGKIFHLLGISRNPIKELIAVKPFGDLVGSVDSSFPFRLFSRGKRIGEHRPYPPHDPMNKKDLSKELLNFCIEEFKVFLEWVEAPSHGV